MINDEALDKIYRKMQPSIEEKIYKEYHSRLKQINENDEEERNNIKMGIISELYYKQGFIDGMNFMLKNMLKK